MSNEWFEKGELPPVGVKCEYIDNHARNYKRCKIDFIGARLVVIKTDSEGEKAIAISKVKFRPTRTERERAIEAAYNAVNKKELASMEWNAHAERLFNQLYDGGVLRAPEDKS